MEFELAPTAETQVRVDPRYDTEDRHIITLIEQRRQACRHGLTATARKAFLAFGLAQGSLDSPLSATIPLISLGCGGCQVEQMVFGQGLKNLATQFTGVDLVIPQRQTRRFPQSANLVSGVNILDPELPASLPFGNLIDIDTLPIIPPSDENLGAYIALAKEHLESEKGELHIFLTYPASKDWWSPASNGILLYPSNQEDLDIEKLDLSTGLYLLPEHDLEIVADILMPRHLLFSDGDVQQRMLRIFEYFDTLVHRFIVDGEKIWGKSFRSQNTLETIDDNSTTSVEGLCKKLFRNIAFVDPENPLQRINAAHAITTCLFEDSEEFETFWVKQALLPELKDKTVRAMTQAMGVLTMRTVFTIICALQVAAFDAVIQKRFKEAGLQIDQYMFDSELIATNHQSRRLPGAVRNGFPVPRAITNKTYYKYADRIDWLLGEPLHSRQNIPASNIMQRGQLLAYHVHK
jgi:hypothetical protein